MYLGHGRPSYIAHRRAALLPTTSPPSQKNELALAVRKASTHQRGGTSKGLFAWSQAVGTSCLRGRGCPGPAMALPLATHLAWQVVWALPACRSCSPVSLNTACTRLQRNWCKPPYMQIWGFFLLSCRVLPVSIT